MNNVSPNKLKLLKICQNNKNLFIALLIIYLIIKKLNYYEWYEVSDVCFSTVMIYKTDNNE